MAAHAVGADQDQRADRIKGRLADLVGRGLRNCGRAVGQRRALGCCRVTIAAASPHTISAVTAVADNGSAPGRPAGAAHFVQKFAHVVVQRAEKVAPARIYAVRIFKKFGVYFGNERRVGAIQKRRLFDNAAHLSSAAFCHVLQCYSALWGRCVASRRR